MTRANLASVDRIPIWHIREVDGRPHFVRNHFGILRDGDARIAAYSEALAMALYRRGHRDVVQGPDCRIESIAHLRGGDAICIPRPPMVEECRCAQDEWDPTCPHYGG